MHFFVKKFRSTGIASHYSHRFGSAVRLAKRSHSSHQANSNERIDSTFSPIRSKSAGHNYVATAQAVVSAVASAVVFEPGSQLA